MATESFLVTCLPHTVDPAERVHLSLFITHRLTPDGTSGKLADFPHVGDWTARLAGAEISLTGLATRGARFAIPVTPDLDRLDPDLWKRVFPPDLEVRPWQTPDPTSLPWRAFPAHRMQAHALLVHAAAVYSSLVDSPSVGGNVITGFLLQLIAPGEVLGRLTYERLLRKGSDIDGSATRILDDWTANGQLGRGVGTSAARAGERPLRLLAADAHRARRYYQRPEEQRRYRTEPRRGAIAPAIKKPDPDFHQRASMIGDLSPLLRRLGLIVDLTIDDLGLVAGAVEIRAKVTVPGLHNPVAIQPATACAVQGFDFFARSKSGDYVGPALRLGDEERFRVLDLDPDATGLKLEQYVRNIPRLCAVENNGDPASSAPPTLRATGFGLARVDRAEELHTRLADAPARDAAVLAGTAPPLHLEDLARGLRLEVWDDASHEWHSLHRRRIDVEVDGVRVLDDVDDTGFLQGAALTQADDENGAVAGAPLHAHEVLAGWDGWSLAAPRPGKVVIHDGGTEKLVDAPPPDPDPVNPVATTSRIAPLTLPWLRYGRSYSFRAWAVDLAGNSAPHAVAGPPTEDGSAPERAAYRPPRRRRDPKLGDHVARTIRKLAAARLAETPRDATRLPGQAESEEAATAVRESLRAAHRVAEPGPRDGEGAPGLDLTTLAPTGCDEVDTVVRQRLASRRQQRKAAGPSRRGRIEASFHEEALKLDHLVERTDAQTPPAMFAEALTRAALTHPGLGALRPDVFGLLLDSVTTPRPFLRWDPVVEPVVVPRHPYTEAESLLTLVVRSGVEGPCGEDGLDLQIVAPVVYADQTLAAHPSLGLHWREDSQRHLAPPKTSQLEAELHGMLDQAFGAASQTAVRTALGIALREAGNFLDDSVADLANPGARLKQPGVSFHTAPTAETPDVDNPGELGRGDPLTPGQYVAHDTDEVVVPYLPDPLASGLSMVFPDAGRDHRLHPFFATEGLRLDYRGSWPERRPYRMVLESGEELAARVAGGEIRFRVPPGEQLRLRLSSAVDRQALELLGLWRSLPDPLRNLDVFAEAAADGWFWWLTPATEVRLVHAVPRPVEAPRLTMLVPIRSPGSTEVILVGGVDLHGPSTERLDVEASWSEWVDDLAKPEPERVDVVAAAAHTTVRYDEDLVILAGEDRVEPLPDGTELNIHKTVHQLGDTKHRDLEYRMRATTRYREYFEPRVVPTPDDLSVVGPPRRLDVPSSARPAKPIVRDVLPFFRWTTETEPEQPFALRRTRRGGLRLYLERPWYSSGDGELLGVVLASGRDVLVEDRVSQWGADPVFWQQGPAKRGILPLIDIPHLFGLDDRRESGRPVGPPELRTLVDVAGNPAVWILGYEPEYSVERGMWFVDVAIDPGSAIWPFVRLAVTRYQPSSLAGLHLSPVVRCEMVPLPPERIATLTRPDNRHARVVVTGTVGVPQEPASTGLYVFSQGLAATRILRARLERKVPGVRSDLAWKTVATRELPILGFDKTIVSWSGELDLPAALPPRRPGTSQTWRVTVEEWERLPADPETVDETASVEARMVYADHLAL